MFRFACLLLALVAACSGAAIPEDRIVGGQNARLGQVPSQVSLRNNNAHFCGGSIVNQRWVLTAAHCLGGSTASGTVVTNTLTLNSGGDVYSIERSIPHPQYNSWTLSNDIGLIKTASDIVFRTDTVQPAKMPTSSFTAVDAPGVVSGWGRTSFPGNIPNHLQFLVTNIISQAECRAASWRVTENHICTFTKTGEGACHGDSGGPLTADGILIALVSFGQPCAVGVPDVFTRIYEHIKWIKSHTG